MRAHKQYGMTLIELMVALAIGMFLMIGAITVFMQSRTTFRVTESLARMQENGRFALEALEPDIRMAHYWGLSTMTTSVTNRVAPAAGNLFGRNPCAANAALVLDMAIAGSNNSYGFGCAAFGVAEANADTLVVRRVAEDAETPPLTGTAGTLRINSVRSPSDFLIVTGTGTPVGFDPVLNEIHRLLLNGYYIDRTSATGATMPSLRVKALRLNGTCCDDLEVIPGIEDMQVQLGIDMDPAGDTWGSIDRYVNVNDPLVDRGNAGFNPDATVLAVRLWLRVRAERPENGFVDTTNYVYADQNVGPFNDGFRRIVVSKTIYLRNARPIPAF
jgi:prepilin-type N-terminal cleavage/methylation domain-containing protein